MSVLDSYLKYTEDTEPPIQFHRWSFLSCIGSAMGKNVWIDHGHNRIYPNMYTMLVGVPGTRKSTAIGMAKKLLMRSGYNNFAFNRSSKEKFLLDFETGFDVAGLDNGDKFAAALDKPFEPTFRDYAEAFICADEFADFIGPNNANFINLLTILWDAKDEPYSERLKTSKSVKIHNPVVNILGGITPTSLAYTMPPEVIGQGFMSRLLLIFNDPRNKKITWPQPPDEKAAAELEEFLLLARNVSGPCKVTPAARQLIDKIYQNYENLQDARLQYYCSRRLTHLLKLCMICALCHGEMIVTEVVVTMANTILTYAERNMHRALGEFGEARHSKATQKIMETVSGSDKPVAMGDLWKAVSADLNRPADLAEIVMNLVRAEKLEEVEVNGVHKVRIPIKGHTANNIAVDYAQWIPEYEEETNDQLLVLREEADKVDKEINQSNTPAGEML